MSIVNDQCPIFPCFDATIVMSLAVLLEIVPSTALHCQRIKHHIPGAVCELPYSTSSSWIMIAS